MILFSCAIDMLCHLFSSAALLFICVFLPAQVSVAFFVSVLDTGKLFSEIQSGHSLQSGWIQMQLGIVHIDMDSLKAVKNFKKEN